MKWQKILKNEIDFEDLADEVESFRLEEASVVRWDDWRDFYNRIGDDPMYPSSANAGELRGELDESQRKYIDKHIREVLDAVDDYNSAISLLSNALYELQPEEEEEPEDDDIRYTTSGGRGRVKPEYRGYKLKDDEMWAEDSDGLLYPVKHRDDVSF